jgi:hypothetical protein
MCLDLPTETHAPLAALDTLLAFRAAVYDAFGHRRDALFGVMPCSRSRTRSRAREPSSRRST